MEGTSDVALPGRGVDLVLYGAGKGRGLAEKGIHGGLELGVVFHREGPDPVSRQDPKLIAHFLVCQEGPQPAKTAEFPVQLFLGAPKGHGEKHQAPPGLHGLPDGELAGFRRKLPVDLVQTVPGAVEPQLVIFRIASAGLRLPDVGLEFLQVRHLVRGQGPGFNAEGFLGRLRTGKEKMPR